MSTTLTILSPVPEPRPADSAAGAEHRLPQIARVGLLSNGKPNSDHLLAGIREVLDAEPRFRLALELRKPSSSHPAEQAVLDRLTASADLVVSATAD